MSQAVYGQILKCFLVYLNFDLTACPEVWWQELPALCYFFVVAQGCEKLLRAQCLPWPTDPQQHP